MLRRGAHGLLVKVGEANGTGAEGDGFFKQLAQEGDPGGARAVKNSAVGPPEDIVRVKVGFAVTAIAALRRGLPKTAGHGVAGKIAPLGADIALVFALVEDDGFLPVGTPLCAELHARVLHAGVGAPPAAVFVLVIAVVDRTQVIECIVFAEDLRVAVPIGVGLGAEQVVLVGERPPDVAISAESRDA